MTGMRGSYIIWYLSTLYLCDAFQIKTASDLNEDIRVYETYNYFFVRAKDKLTWFIL